MLYEIWNKCICSLETLPSGLLFWSEFTSLIHYQTFSLKWYLIILVYTLRTIWATFHIKLVKNNAPFCCWNKVKNVADENTSLLIDQLLVIQVMPYIKTVYLCSGRSLATDLVFLPQGSSLCAHYNPHMRIICLLQKPTSRFSKWKAVKTFITLKADFALPYSITAKICVYSVTST